MPKGYKTISVTTKAYDNMKKYHEKMNVKTSFSGWLSEMLGSKQSLYMINDWMEDEARAMANYIKLMDELS